jgi:hypothetical protein
MLQEFYTWGWVVIIGMFGILEGFAIANKQTGDTFSEHVKKWFGVRGTSRSHKIRRTVLGLFLCWLGPHLMGWI